MMTSWEQETKKNVNKKNNSKHTPKEHSKSSPSSSQMLRGMGEPGHSSAGTQGLTTLTHMPLLPGTGLESIPPAGPCPIPVLSLDKQDPSESPALKVLSSKTHIWEETI